MISLILVGMARPTRIAQINKFAKSLQYLKKEVRDEVNFLCRWASQLLINVAELGESTQNNKHAMSLQHLKKELID